MYSILNAFARLLIDTLIYRDRSDAKLRAEVLALRHQLRVLERQTNRPRWQPTDRLLLAAISPVLPRPLRRSLLPVRRRRSAPASSKVRAARAHRSPRPRELGLGLSSHPGRAAPGRPPLLSPDRAKSAASPQLAPGAAPQPALLARVRPPARRQDPGMRLSSPWTRSG